MGIAGMPEIPIVSHLGMHVDIALKKYHSFTNVFFLIAV